jgi:hypothetical protein
VLAAAALCVLLWRGAADQPAIVAAAVTASAAVTVAALTRTWTARAAADAQHRAEMAPIYAALVQESFARMTRPWHGETPGPRHDAAAPITPDEIALADFYDDAKQKLLVWGSPTVITGWIVYEKRVRQITPGTPDPWPWLDAFEDLLLVLRKDLGHNDRSLATADLLRMFLSDVDGRPERATGPR